MTYKICPEADRILVAQSNLYKQRARLHAEYNEASGIPDLHERVAAHALVNEKLEAMAREETLLSKELLKYECDDAGNLLNP